MANVLKIKSRTSGSGGAPGSIAQSELAYNEQDNTLYIGHGSGTDANRTKKAIAGVGAFVDLASSQTLTNKDLTATTNTFPAAGAAQVGVVELATDEEANTGTDATRAVTPDNLGAWTGNTAITSVGTIGTGVWSGTALVAGKVPNLEDLTVGGNIDVNAKRITNLAAPTAANDAARKADVDAAVQGLDVRESVRLAATADVPSPGTGVSAAHTVDGVTVVAGDRILLKAQNPASENGIYVVAYDAGNSGAEWTMDRAEDLNANADCSANMFFFVEEGTSLADTGWVCTTNETVTLANMVFAQFSGTGSYTAGNGLDLTGTAFSLDLKANGGLVIESTEVAVDLGASSITGTLDAPDGGTGLTEITENGIMYGKGSGENSISVTAAGGNNALLYSNSGTPAWTTTPDGLTIDCGTF